MLPALLLVCLLASSCALAQDSYIDPSLTEDKLVALGDLIDSIVQFAYTTNVSSSDSTTRTAVGYLMMDNDASVTFENTEARATSTGLDVFHFPELGLDLTTYINPLPSSITVTPYQQKRDLSPTPTPTASTIRANRQKERRGLIDERGQTPMDVCPIPKTVTVIEWIDCAATPSVACDVCPVTQSCDSGWEWILPTSTQIAPTRSCNSYTPSIADEYITIAHGDGYTGSPTLTIGPSDIDIDYVYLATLVISSNSQLLLSSKYPLLADWSSQLTWSVTTIPTPASSADEFVDEIYDEEIPSIIESLDPEQSYPTETPVWDGGAGIDDPTGNGTLLGDNITTNDTASDKRRRRWILH